METKGERRVCHWWRDDIVCRVCCSQTTRQATSSQGIRVSREQTAALFLDGTIWAMMVRCIRSERSVFSFLYTLAVYIIVIIRLALSYEKIACPTRYSLTTDQWILFRVPVWHHVSRRLIAQPIRSKEDKEKVNVLTRRVFVHWPFVGWKVRSGIGGR